MHAPDRHTPAAHCSFVSGPCHKDLMVLVMPGPPKFSLCRPKNTIPVDASAPHRLAPAQQQPLPSQMISSAGANALYALLLIINRSTQGNAEIPSLSHRSTDKASGTKKDAN